MAEASPDDFKRLLRRLHPDPKVAGDIYLTLWQKLVTALEHRNCPAAEDEAHKVLDRIARRVDLDAIENIQAFAYGVVRVITNFELPKNKEIALSEVAEEKLYKGEGGDSETQMVERIDRERRVRCLVQCIAKLPRDDRSLLLAFKLANPETCHADRRKLAEQRSVSADTLRVSVWRIRIEVERCALKCLKRKGKTIF